MAILVTGGAGYIGSHACVELLQAGYPVVVLDNFSNSSPKALERVRQITGKDIVTYEADLCDRQALEILFSQEPIDAVIHFAGLKAVGESVAEPLRYYANNLSGTINLLEQMQNNGVFRLVFSSSATVYGDPHTVPIVEGFPLSATNPYGQTKLMIETMLRDMARADARWHLMLLRYFNPIGAHASGLIGEDPRGIPNNLMPYINKVAAGKLAELSVFGGDYPTPDGTGVRDYIHVVDLVLGHLAALRAMDRFPGAHAFNLGTGAGYSVLEMVSAFERVTGQKVPYRITARRPGDIAACYADASAAARELGWKAGRGLDEMMADGWRWQSGNPGGYEG